MNSLLIISLLLILVAVCSADTEPVSVTLKGGQIIGRKHIVDGKPVNIFLGIPYAEPPVGNLRFKKPVPFKQWSDAINAYELPISCYQLKWAIDALIPDYKETFQNPNVSEDCLYLNIWSPVESESLSDDNLKAVMFWIHGGGLGVGSTNEYIYNGEMLSAKGDVVVVSVNYRLNIFGFLYTGTEDAPGNVGLLDQTLALEWVNDNIKYFGGDPQRITIFGESAGGWSVSAHILSPLTRNLYQNAIMMSGAITSRQTFDDPSVAKAKWLRGAKLVGCGGDSDADSFTPEIIDCLRNTDPDILANISMHPEVIGQSAVSIFAVIDGHYLTKTPIDSLKTGDYKKNLNLLLGTAEDEGSFFLSFLVDPVKHNPRTPSNITYTDAYDTLTNLMSSHMFAIPIREDIAGDVAKVYFTEISPNSEDSALLRRTVGIAIGDYLIGCPTLLFAKELYDNDRIGNNVYQYYYKSKIGKDRGICSEWMGACHLNDVWPVFGLSFIHYDDAIDEEREESIQVIDFFSHFAKHGYPSPQNGKLWPKYYTVNGNTVAPYLELSAQSNRPVSQFKNNLKTIECETLFREYLFV